VPRKVRDQQHRYNNHLNPLTVRDSWGEHEERLLFRLHDELGNKWAVIAARLGGRYLKAKAGLTTA
jgi:myb proto-oncogene protein/myb-related protein